MARAKKASSASKRRTTTKRNCKTTRKRTGAAAKNSEKENTNTDVIEWAVPKKIPAKQSKMSKLLKVLLGTTAAAGLGVAGVAAYRNRDKLGKAGKDGYDAIAAMTKKYFANSKKAAKDLMVKGKQKASDILATGKQKYADWRYGARTPTDPLYGTYRNSDMMAITDGRDKPFKTTYIPPSYWANEPMAITSGLEMDVVKELIRIKDTMNTTNRVDMDFLNHILDEYHRQALRKDYFAGSYITPDLEEAGRLAERINDSKEESAIAGYKNDLDFILENLITKFNKISRGEK